MILKKQTAKTILKQSVFRLYLAQHMSEFQAIFFIS